MDHEFTDIIAVTHNAKLGKPVNSKEVDELKRNTDNLIQNDSESKDPFIIRGKLINSFSSYMDTLGLKYTEPIDVPYKEVND